MFSSSSCDSESSDGDHKRPATTLSRRRSYSVSRGCTTTTRESSQYGKCRSSEEACSAQLAADQPKKNSVIEAATSNENVNNHVIKSDMRPNSKRFSRSNNQPFNKLESSDTETASSSSSNTDDSTDNDTDTENQCGISLNYIRPLLDSDECVDSSPNSSSEQCSNDHLEDQDKAYINNTTNSTVIDTRQTEINYQNTDQIKIVENCAKSMNCSDFTELSREQALVNQHEQLQEQVRTSHELDDTTSGVQSNEQFGLHSQSSSNENKLSTDTMVIINDGECVNETTHKSCADPTSCLQSNVIDNEIEACDSNIEAHKIEQYAFFEVDSIKDTIQLTKSDEGTINLPDFVIITIEEAEFNSNNSSNDKHSHKKGNKWPFIDKKKTLVLVR